jgi:hypothetical protein
MKHRKCSFSRIEMNCKEGMNMYVDDDRVVTTMSIYKIQVDYGGNSHTRNSRKTKGEGKGLALLYNHQKAETLNT